MNIKDIAGTIDHTLLKPEATSIMVEKLCFEAIENQFCAVCVNSTHLPLVKSLLHDSAVKVATVVGFPLGANLSSVKSFEVEAARQFLLHEVDMVMNVGAMKDQNYKLVQSDIEEVVKASSGLQVKVILETSLLTLEEIAKASKICEQAGAHFVKTSTGFGGGGASVEHIELIRNSVGPKMKIKASGGIQTQEQALALLRAGAHRLGTSRGVDLVKGISVQKSGY